MKVLLSWLREFVDVPGTAEDIANTMSVRGLAVEAVEPAGEDDAVLDFETFANRPDTMSIAGIAREVATAHGLPLRAGGATFSGQSRGEDTAAPEIDVVLDNAALCPRYVGAVAHVTVAASPAWMQQRLTACGIRPISNIVDITNYVLLELGQPMHAFDKSKLHEAQIRVRNARAGEKLKTLDGQVRELTPDMLVIADARAAVAIAGVMGGAESEVSDRTTAIVFESAYFDPLAVRRTSRKLGLKTEASMRFERGADPHQPVRAMLRAIELLESIGAGQRRGGIVDRTRTPFGIEPKALGLRRDSIGALLGAAIPDDAVERILTSLGFSLVRVESGWRVAVPTGRVDVDREIDLIEDVARHWGFDKLPATFPPLVAPPPPSDPRIARARQLRTVMAASGFSEAVTFGFMSHAAAAPFAAAEDLVPIANPLSETFAVLRPSPLPGILDAVAHNRRREQHDVRLFEVGAGFSRRNGERRALACAWTGAGTPAHWSGSERPVDFFDVKGLAERLGDLMRVPVAAEPHVVSWLVAGRSAMIASAGRELGVMGQLAPAIADSHGLPAQDPVYVLELDLDALEALTPKGDVRVERLPRYPSVTRDISLLLDDTVAAAQVRSTIAEAAPPTLVDVGEFDRYQGKGVPDGKVSLSLHLTFRSPDRTLTDGEVHDAMAKVVAALVERHGATQR
jgi:phenylalanyl-tRNA synthetase beta chain